MITDTFVSTEEMASDPLPFYRFTVDEYRRLGEAGVLTEEHGVELLEGRIVRKMNLNPPHSVCVKLCDHWIGSVLPAEWHTRVQDAVQTKDSEPEPDVAVVRGSIRDYAKRHPGPTEIAMLVEVADSSLRRDHYKCKIYGNAGIPVYWIVNLSDRRIEVYSEPTGPDAQPGYRRREEFAATEEVPLVIDGQEIARVVGGELLV